MSFFKKNSNNRFLQIDKFILSIFTVVLLCMASSESFASSYLFKESMMGTELEITIADTTKANADKVAKLAFIEIDRIEKLMSSWMKNSELSKVNKNAGIKPVTVSDELYSLLKTADNISRLTDGAFDITIGNLLKHWKFNNKTNKLPADKLIKQGMSLVDFKQIIFNDKNKTVFLSKKGMSAGLGGIAKGYAVDKAMEVLIKNGINNAIVKAGGDMKIEGTNEDKGWQIAIQHPRHNNKVIGSIELKGVSVSTSGDYERYFMLDGKRYHHIIDPKTGYPSTGIQSATIVGKNTTTTDALATSIMIMGEKHGMKLIESLPGIEGLLINKNGQIITSSGFGTQVTK